MERYTPKELEIPFPEIVAINIGGCPGTETHYEKVSPFRAHTHLCKKDLYYKNICIWTKDYLFNSDSSISDILWHEYAHVLDANYIGPLVVQCNVGGVHGFEFPSEKERKEFDSTGHGLSWERIMVRFGMKPNRYANRPY